VRRLKRVGAGGPRFAVTGSSWASCKGEGKSNTTSRTKGGARALAKTSNHRFVKFVGAIAVAWSTTVQWQGEIPPRRDAMKERHRRIVTPSKSRTPVLGMRVKDSCCPWKIVPRSLVANRRRTPRTAARWKGDAGDPRASRGRRAWRPAPTKKKKGLPQNSLLGPNFLS